MKSTRSYSIQFLILAGALLLAFGFNIAWGSVEIPFESIWDSIMNPEEVKESWRIIIRDFRIPKAITACIAGAGLSISGLLMQTLFRNPLAGPFILGISSGASLGVAVLVMGVGLFGGVMVGFT